MQTDYKNLGWFDTAIVGLIVAGLFLIGSMVFSSLSARQQSHFVAALDILDMHKQVPQELELINFIAFDVPESYLNTFYSSFVKVASIPQENLPDFSVVPKGISMAYNTVVGYPIPKGGVVLGASTLVLADCDPPKMSSTYDFSTPRINLSQFTKVDISFEYFQK